MNIGIISISVSGGLVFDASGRWGTYETGGVGVGLGLGGWAGGELGGSNAQDIKDLRDWFANGSRRPSSLWSLSACSNELPEVGVFKCQVQGCGAAFPSKSTRRRRRGRLEDPSEMRPYTAALRKALESSGV